MAIDYNAQQENMMPGPLEEAISLQQYNDLANRMREAGGSPDQMYINGHHVYTNSHDLGRGTALGATAAEYSSLRPFRVEVKPILKIEIDESLTDQCKPADYVKGYEKSFSTMINEIQRQDQLSSIQQSADSQARQRVMNRYYGPLG